MRLLALSVLLFAASTVACGSSNRSQDASSVDAAVGDASAPAGDASAPAGDASAPAGDARPATADTAATDAAPGATDGASVDAAAGFANLPGQLLFRFAHMHSSGTGVPTFPDAVDVCLTPINGTPVRLYGGTPGVGRFQVGAWRVMNFGMYTMKVILPSQTCSDAGVYSAGVEQISDSVHRRVTYVLITSGAGLSGTARIHRAGPTDVASSDLVSYTSGVFARIPALTFTDGAGTVPLGNNTNVLLAPGRSGTLTMSFTPKPPADVTRGFRSAATGHVSVISYGNPTDNNVGFVVCDDLAAPVGQLSRCDATVRAP